ncbi:MULTISPECIES: winged helix-turn-helix transcriptional regulator [Nocardia]|jgi:DNA-binding HxlR family transcriptional regulator|uniref:winged helix-turn-helix transcriptional regulator n=1 Tax=Nocardia abscessus TaxID=120957 RepID=UPI0018933DF4|nr:helix-turn-helix domain-containing protein [Nocardia abscessus]MBF6472144.1 helix-turn-helix transcriptional regulator [Nocardia abscessus]
MTLRRPIDDSVTRVVELLGDRWTILLIAEAFFGVHRFSDFARNIGITNRNLLTSRLRMLIDAGIFTRTDHGGGRVDYHLTAAGRELYPIVTAMMVWGDNHLVGPEGRPIVLEHRSCGQETSPMLVCDHCREPIDPRDVEPKAGPGFHQPPGAEQAE